MPIKLVSILAVCLGASLGALARWQLSEAWRLLLVTGLLGGLTTFSAFSAEVVQFIQQGKWSLVGMEILLHVGGSILLTLLGVATYFALR